MPERHNPSFFNKPEETQIYVELETCIGPYFIDFEMQPFMI